jgi:hypothetical protein
LQRLRPLSIALLATVVGACGGGGGNAVAPSPSEPPPAAPAPVSPPILPPVTPAWHAPTCSSVTGAPVTFTSDGGLNRAPIETPAASDYFTYGVATLEAGSTLAAIVGPRTTNSAELYFSADAGCSWQPSGHTVDSEYGLPFEVTELDGYAYAWRYGGDTLYAIERTGLAPLKMPDTRWSSNGPEGLGIDPNNPERIRIAVWECERVSCGHGSTIFETSDRGTTWTMVGTHAPYGAFGLRFSPTNFDHVIALSPTPAGHVSFDGGNLWLPAEGVPADWNSREAALGHDGHTVWLLANPDVHPTPTNASAMYVSHDGGLNYQEAFSASDEHPFVFLNPTGDAAHHAKIFPHPSDGDVVYLAYTSPADATSYLYRYDAGLDQLTKRQWPLAEGGVSALAFNPADADVLYLGLAAVD